MKNIINSFIIAFSMYSKIPMPQCEWKEENMSYAMVFWPWVGAVIGLLVYGWSCFGSLISLNQIFYVIILVMISVLVTGGIHLDGFLDTTDAMSSWQTRERRLEILKDSNSGAFAVIHCSVYFLLMVAAYSQLSKDIIPVVGLGFMLSRTMSAYAIVSFKKAKKDGSVAALSRGASTKTVQKIMLIYWIFLALLMILVNPAYGLAALLGAFIVFAYYHYMAMKYFGGTTGDLAGWFLSACELVMPMACVILKLIFEIVEVASL